MLLRGAALVTLAMVWPWIVWLGCARQASREAFSENLREQARWSVISRSFVAGFRNQSAWLYRAVAHVMKAMSRVPFAGMYTSSTAPKDSK